MTIAWGTPIGGRRLRALAAVVVLCLAIAGCSDSTAGEVKSPFSNAAIHWTPCADADQRAFPCATYPVPLDWQDPDGRKIELALRKLPASGTSEGPVFFNPGGPGGTASGAFVEWAGLFPRALTERYDLISWDPRGIGESTSAQCFPSFAAELDVIGDVPAFAETYDQQRQYLAAFKKLSDTCAASPDAKHVLEHLSTADTARDLEQLRVAVGGAPLAYWGVSYGTYLGATYANLFPDNIRAMVLDGNIAPRAWTGTGAPERSMLGLRVGATESGDVFDYFLTECSAAGLARCAFAADSVAATTTKWNTILDRLGRGPLPFTDPDGVTQDMPDVPRLVTSVADDR